MKKEVIKKLRELAGKNVLVVIADNQQFFYDNLQDNVPLIWDDDNEILYSVGLNAERRSQLHHPVSITAVEYENIQFIKINKNIKDTIEFIDDNKTGIINLDEDKLKSAINNLYV